MKKKIILGVVAVILLGGSLYTLTRIGTFDDLASTRLGAAVMNVFSSNNSSTYNIRLSKTVPGAFTFNYKFENVTPPRGQVNFDIPIAQFDEKAAREELEVVYPGQPIDFGQYRDAWGYPVHENSYQTLGNKKTSFNPFKIEKALASDNDPNIPGLVNCRANTSVTGYFKASFQDVVLDTNVGYDDPIHGQARRNEACQVLQDIGTLIKLDTTTVTPSIWFNKDPGNLPANVLAVASSYYTAYSVGPQSYYTAYSVGPDNGMLHKYILSHEDPIQGSEALIITNFNGIGWDVDSTLNTNTYDLYTVLYHEVLHALGFRGLLPVYIASTGGARFHDTFDLFSYKDSTLLNPFFSAVTELLQVPIGNPSPWFITNTVVYRGIKNIVGATPDGIRPIFSPNPWQTGSSLSHFDMNRAPGQTYIMHPSIGTNTERVVHADEKEVLCHLGYRVLGIIGCDVATPVAVDDSISIDNVTEVCINPFINDNSFSGGVLSLQGIIPISLQTGDTLTYYQSVDCSGLTQASPSNARSIKFTLGDSIVSRQIVYTNRDSVSNRISFPAKINLVSCEVSSDEYVCNGDFEQMPFSIGRLRAFDCPTIYQPYHIVPFWCGDNTSDLAEHDGNGNNQANLPFNCQNQFFSECQIDTINHTGRAAVSAVPPETIITKLKTSLTSGTQYKLSYDVIVIAQNSSLFNSTYITSTFVDARFDSDPSFSILPQLLPHQNVPFNVATNQWTHVDQVFTAMDDYDYLELSGNFTATNNNQHILSFFDNISITEISEDVCPNITGMQAVIPVGYEIVNGRCQPIVVDKCLNITGVQSTIPTGFQLVNGECKKIQAVDMCSNITGIQSVLPSGYYQSLGKCFPNNSSTPTRY